jgi:FkbM family methyltransferase
MRATLLARNAARKLGLTRVIGKFLNRRGYEASFDQALNDAIRPGDVVWDVGANVGYYSAKFAELAGPQGTVYAFEPSPVTVERLRSQVGGLANVKLMPVGLGAAPASLRMVQGEDELGATSQILDDAGASGTMEVRVDSGDRMVAQGEVAPPNVVKIDVEGFEAEVLQGMRQTLRAPTLRTVCMEIHFELLKDRGMPGAPRDMERLLKESGFRIRWADYSHLIGTRA